MPDHFELERFRSVKGEDGAYYKVIGRLGVGGNAVTFLAYTTEPHKEKGTLVAIKFFRKLSDNSRREAFRKEIAFLRQCEHPAIMWLLDDGVYHRNPFLVAEYLPSTLRGQMIKGMLLVEKILAAMQLLSALVFLDSLSPPAVHRDIKPANIFVKGGSVLLGDFGLVKRLGAPGDQDRTSLAESITGAKLSKGVGMPRGYRTPDLVAYLNGKGPPSTKSDVFQLGLVLAELFTGRNPSRPYRDVKAPVRLEPIGHVPGKAGAGVAVLIGRMLHLNPASRPSASELLDSWEGVLRDVVNDVSNVEGRILAAEALTPPVNRLDKQPKAAKPVPSRAPRGGPRRTTNEQR